jgi:hypothetical protein
VHFFSFDLNNTVSCFYLNWSNTPLSDLNIILSLFRQNLLDNNDSGKISKPIFSIFKDSDSKKYPNHEIDSTPAGGPILV